MRNLAVIFIISFVVLGFGSCKSSIVTWEDNSEPGRRNYVWTSDTLKIPFTRLFRIWGDANDNLWAVGPGGDLDKTIYHFDGISWKNDGVWRNFRPWYVFGFDKNDVWMGGENGEIWHNSNGVWTKNYQHKIAGFDFITINYIGGDNTNDIYAVGVAENNYVKRGFILHKNDSGWSQQYLANYNSTFSSFKHGKIFSDSYFLIDIKQTKDLSTDTITVNEYNNNMKEIYRSLRTDADDISHNSIGGIMYFSLGDGIYRFCNGVFYNMFKVSDPANFTKGVFGRSGKDLFLTMMDGIAHYNGSNIQYIFRKDSVPCLYFGGMVVLEKDIYLLDTSIPGINIIHHGTLKD